MIQLNGTVDGFTCRDIGMKLTNQIRDISQWICVGLEEKRGSQFSDCGQLRTYECFECADSTGVTDMSYRFCNASSLNGDMNQWNIASVIDMCYMFRDASSFNVDHVSSWNLDAFIIDS